MSDEVRRTPFPWYGSKKGAAATVWEHLGGTSVYYEPFAGSLAVLLNRPEPTGREFVGDVDSLLSNFWRALAADHEGVRRYITWPNIEQDFHARAAWLTDHAGIIAERVAADPDWYDPKAAGWWAWVVCNSLHPARWTTIGNHPEGIAAGSGKPDWEERFAVLAARVRGITVRCSWESAVRDQPKGPVKGVFLDPPYKLASRHSRLYREEVHDTLHGELEAWCLERGGDPEWRIVVAGFPGDFDLPGWSTVAWSRDPRETLWISPHCIRPADFLF